MTTLSAKAIAEANGFATLRAETLGCFGRWSRGRVANLHLHIAHSHLHGF